MQGELSIIKCQGETLITCGQSAHVRVWGVGLDGAGADLPGAQTLNLRKTVNRKQPL